MSKWIQTQLGALVTFQRGYDLPKRLRKFGNTPIFGSAGIIDYHSVAKEIAPGIVTGRYGTIGELFYSTEDFWPLNTTLFVKDFHGNDPKFVFYMLHRFDFNNFSGKSGVPGVNRNDLHSEPIIYPKNIDEQRTIAQILSDVDALIDSIDRLITKKRDLKQATMQQLLTGKTRLPGFEGTWIMKRLGDIIEKIIGGGTPSRSNHAYWGGNIPWATVKDLSSFNPDWTQESITSAGLKNSASHLIPQKTLIVSTRMALGKAVIYEVDVAINQDLKALFLKPENDLLFTYYWFEANAKMIDELGSGSTVKGISIAQLRAIRFPGALLPEQQAIATVLSNIDLELNCLEKRLEKTKFIKQGMMQELLTGRTRLI